MRVGKLRVAGVVGVLLALTGCVGSEPLPTLPPTPTATPIFASEEEALAAAADAYAEYLGMSALIASEGGANPERIEPFVTEARLEVELRGFAIARSTGLRILGASEFQVEALQRVDQDHGVEVVFYACWDASGSRVLNSDGADVTPVDRVDRALLEVVMVMEADSNHFLLESDDPWPNTDC